jgi:hypothetical protein
MNAMGFKVSQDQFRKKTENVIPPIDFQHILCEGATGTGKTASIILPILEDRLRKGHTIIFFDHKGHEHKKVKALAKKIGRLKDVVEIGKPYTSYINLLAELDTIRLKEMVKEAGKSKDPYWSNSAANLAEDIIAPLRKLYDIVHLLKDFKIFINSSGSAVLTSLEEVNIDILKKPSFQTLSNIIASPKALINYKKVMSTIPEKLRSVLDMDYKYGEKEITDIRQIYGKILFLEKSIEAASRFNISEDKSDVNSGNNGVLQTLDNTVASYAKKDYINIDEYTIADLMNKNAIIVIDTQSFGDDIMKIFLESILKKAVMRLRAGRTSAMSVFIDEANRVLFPSIDLHSDVLREAEVELIIAIQNEEQMIKKFSEVEWNSIKGNIKHQYMIELSHGIRYNYGELMTTKPLLFEKELLEDADYAYFTLDKNRTNLQKNFLGEIDALPEKFTVNYDLDLFEHESAITIEDKYGDVYAFSYHGEEIVNEVNETYPTRPIMEQVVEIKIPLIFDDEEFEMDELQVEMCSLQDDGIDHYDDIESLPFLYNDFDD